MNPTCSSDVPADRLPLHGDVTAGDLISAVSGAVALKVRLGLEYDKIMIVAVIASRHVAQPEPGKDGASVMVDARDGLLAWNGSTMSLARILGIPRESVRRKLLELCDDGWLIPNGQDGRYQPSERLLQAMDDLIRRTRLPV